MYTLPILTYNKVFLYLSIYYFLSKNGYKNTAEEFFNEIQLDKLIKFPESSETVINHASNILENSFKEEMHKNMFVTFIFEYLFLNGCNSINNNDNNNNNNNNNNNYSISSNTSEQKNSYKYMSDCSFIAENWNRFWNYFYCKINHYEYDNNDSISDSVNTSTNKSNNIDNYLKSVDLKMTFKSNSKNSI